jgi:non-ribosomal peptide synthetase component F
MIEDARPAVIIDEAFFRNQKLAADQAADLSGVSEVYLWPYVIYTSGSTGRPKGAMNTHAGIVNRLRWMQERYHLTEADCVLQKTPFSFDVSVWEFFWPLITGARLVLAKPGRPRGSQLPGATDRARASDHHAFRAVDVAGVSGQPRS